MRNINEMFNLKGKTIVITGGAGYLGSSMSEALAAFGADLFILGSNFEKNKKKAMKLKKMYQLEICESIPFDIDQPEVIKQVFSNIANKTGNIDVLINNAAYVQSGNIEDITIEDWRKGIEGTINTTFSVTKEALKYMLSKKSGNIINIASMYGMVAPDQSIYGSSGQNNPANYGAGKAAIIQFTKYVASTYGEKGVRANSISPGAFPDEETQKDKKFICNLCKKTSLKRIGIPEDLQGVIVYLSSNASAYVNGQNIAIDGGWTAW